MVSEFDSFINETELLLRQVNSIIKRRGREILDEFDITPPQFVALQILTKQGSLTIGELGQELYLACSTITDLVDRMERNGLVARFRDDEDRRVVRIKVKEKGHRLINEVIEARREYLRRVLSDISSEDQEKMKYALEQLNNLMDN